MRICPALLTGLAAPLWLSAGLVTVLPLAAHAQGFEDVGTRAQGMAGPFVAVADDATASWWNPAGLATGAYFNVIFEKGRVHEPDDHAGADPARRLGMSGFAAAFPALGVSYYRLRVSEIAATSTTATGTGDREELGGAEGRVRSRSVSQFGTTVGQSFGGHVVLGATLKLVRAGAASAPVDASNDSLDLGDDLDISRGTRTDLDIGAMVSFRHLRLGLSVRNLTDPDFGDGDERFTLERQARAGVALLTTAGGTVSGLTLAADVDLTRQATPFGDARRAAVGAEAMLLGRRLAVRGGLSVNTLDDRGRTTTTGVSVAPLSGVYIEGARAFGSDKSMRGWSSTIRLTF